MFKAGGFWTTTESVVDGAMESNKWLEGKIALITGVGRSVGIGAAICRTIAKNGGDIFFSDWRQYDRATHDYRQNDPADFAAELKQLGSQAASKFTF
jgi:3-oxoacyl-[acyl-carrier protein] reductase